MLCACGCKEPVGAVRYDARYASDACRARAWKRRTAYRGAAPVGTAGNGNPAVSLNFWERYRAIRRVPR